MAKRITRTELQNSVDVTLMPGGLYLSQEPRIIKTILGSCISMIFYNRRHRVSAISHAQLPVDKVYVPCTRQCPSKCYKAADKKLIYKYVSCSSEYILEQLKVRGIRLNEIEVKLFGGSNVLKTARSEKKVGKKNIEAAYDIINKYRLKLVAEDTGGNKGRTLFLKSDTGEVWVYTHTRSPG